MERVFAIIPVKPVEEGKSRLSSILGPVERTRMNALFVKRTLERAAIFPGASRSIVVSRSGAALADATARGMIAVVEEEPDLNAALSSATRRAISLGASGVFVLPVDLPLAGTEALRRIVESCHADRTCVLVPDRHGRGTNMLYLSPAVDDIYRFGEDSFRRHQAAAVERHFQVRLVDDADLSFDIDEPDDYRLWQSFVSRGRGANWSVRRGSRMIRSPRSSKTMRMSSREQEPSNE